MSRGFSFAIPPAIAQEVYRNAEGKTRTLRYRTMDRVRFGKVEVWHLVLIDYPALERGTELLGDCGTKDETRRVWLEGRRRMACAGYEKVDFTKKGS